MGTDLRVLLVDDSRIFRAALQSALEVLPWVRVAGSVFSGEKALALLETTPVDLVLLDMEMPGLCGLDTLHRIQKFNSLRCQSEPVGVVIVSAQNDSRCDTVRQALSAGAFAFVPKPVSKQPGEVPKEELINSLRPVLERYRAKVERLRVTNLNAPKSAPKGLPDPQTPIPPDCASKFILPKSGIRLPFNPRAFCAVGIGVSTGGPRALTQLVPGLTQVLEVPILIVQHMPVGFTASLADSLAKLVPDWSCSEARHGEEIFGKMIRVAPGGHHLEVRRLGTKYFTELNTGATDCGCKPAANVLFRSMASAYGSKVAALVLTGMGCDGTEGAHDIRQAGGLVLAQDEPSCVVWGMPGSAVQAGVVHEVAPLERLPQVLSDWSRRRDGA